VKPNRELSKALAWMGDAFEQCADEVNPPQPNADLRHGVGSRASQPKEMTDEK
jgi:hypothetical protein